MAKDTTKQKILDVALELFAKDGYTSVSIRDICGQVGIKESTVYYHFENKRAIFEALSLRFQAIATDMMRRLDEAMADVNGADPRPFSTVSDAFFEKYLMDDFCNRFIRLMSLEQMGSEDVQQLYSKWMFDEPLRFQSRIFAKLADAGIIAASDSEYLAVKYYSPIFLYTQRYLLSGPLTEEKKTAFRSEVDRHISQFFMECGVR